MTSYSIMVRVRRTIHQSLHVSVPVTEDVMERDADGTAKLDPQKVFAAAVAMGTEGHHVWLVDGEPVVEIHPLQTPPPGFPREQE